MTSSDAPIFWFTGLSGAGKSTVARAVERRLVAAGFRVLVLDGDEVRRRLHRDLGFSEEDIRRNNALIAEMCGRLRGDYDVILVPIISPYRSSRAMARRALEPGFYEIYLNASIEVVRRRDVKGLYSLADRNRITNLIGYSPGSVYEPPIAPDLVLNTGTETENVSIDTFHRFVLERLTAPPRTLNVADSEES